MTEVEPCDFDAFQRLQVAFEGTGDGLWDWDLESGTFWISDQVAEIGGGRDGAKTLSRDQIRLRIHPDDIAAMQAAASPVIKGEAPNFGVDVRLWHLDGQWIWLHMRGTVLTRRSDGSAQRLVGTIRDITNSRELELQQQVLLKLSDALLRHEDAGAMLNSALAILGAHFRPSRVCFGNVDEEAGTLTIRHEWSDGTVPSALGVFPLSAYEKGKEQQVRRGDTVCIPDILEDPRSNHPDIVAAYAPFQVRSALILPMIRNGVFEGTLTFHQSSTRNWTQADIELAENARTRIWDAVIREQAEARMRESERRLSQIFNLTPAIPWVTDGLGEPLMMGEKWSETTGLVPSQAGKEGWVAALHPDDQIGARDAIRHCIATGERMDMRYRMHGKGDMWRWFRLQGAPTRDANGAIDRWYGYISDIHEQVESELQHQVLLKLSDALLREGDAGAMVVAALAILGDHFHPSRVCFADVDDTTGTFTIRHEWLDGTQDSLLGTYPLSRYEQGKDKRIRTGDTVCVPDILAHPRWKQPEIVATYTSHDIRAILSLPMIRNGVFAGILFFHQSTPRVWTKADIELAENARTRIWDAVFRDQAESKLRESEARLASIFETTPTIPWVVDAEGTPIMLGKSYVDATGLTAEKAAAEGWAEAVHPDDRAEAVATVVRCRASGEPMDVRYRLLQADGSYRWVRVQGAPRRDSKGSIQEWAGQISDIHELVEAQLALRRSEEEARRAAALLEQVIETTPDPIWVLDLERRYLLANSATAGVLGRAKAEIIGKHVSALLPLEFRTAAEGQLDMIEGGKEFRGEEPLFDYRFKTLRLFDNHKVPLKGPNGEVIGTMGIGRDVTERKQAEKALRASEAAAKDTALLLEQVLETSLDPIWVVDLDRRYTVVNSAAARVLGKAAADIAGRHAVEILPEPFASTLEAQITAIESGQQFHVDEQVYDRNLKALRYFESTKVPLRGAGQEIIGVMGVSRDITERKEVELRLRAIVDSALDAILVTDEQGTIMSANPATTTVFGYSEAELLGQNISLLMPAEESANHDRYMSTYLQTGVARIIGIGRQLSARRKDGSTVSVEISVAEWFDANGKRHFTGIMRDMTEKMKAEAQVRRAQDTLLSVSRLSAAGAMASTLAHELNQPLTAGSNLLRTARRMLEASRDPEKVPDLLQEAATEILRAGSIIRRMREYTVNGELDPTPQRLVELAEVALASVKRRPEAAQLEVTWSIDPKARAVKADRVQIEQVIVNLLRNANEAMCGSPSRQIEIEIEADGSQTALHVHDHGHGIAPEQMDRLFQPFATTRDSGTGLGLAICRTIVEAHGGQIHGVNRPDGSGATFTITLPVASGGAAARKGSNA